MYVHCFNNIFHNKKNDTSVQINNNIINLLFKQPKYPSSTLVIPRELLPFEFELFFN